MQFGGSISTNLYRNYGVEAASLGDPWFSGTGFLPGATIPLVIGYEWDDIVPDCAVPGPLTVLLRYDGGTAEPSAGATRYTAPSGARVFAAGTMNWSWKLDNFVQAGYDPVGHGVDARVQALTRNVLNLQPAPVNLPPVASMTRSVDEPQAGSRSRSPTRRPTPTARSRPVRGTSTTTANSTTGPPRPRRRRSRTPDRSPCACA